MLFRSEGGQQAVEPATVHLAKQVIAIQSHALLCHLFMQTMDALRRTARLMRLQVGRVARDAFRTALKAEDGTPFVLPPHVADAAAAERLTVPEIRPVSKRRDGDTMRLFVSKVCDDVGEIPPVVAYPNVPATMVRTGLEDMAREGEVTFLRRTLKKGSGAKGGAGGDGADEIDAEDEAVVSSGRRTMQIVAAEQEMRRATEAV